MYLDASHLDPGRLLIERDLEAGLVQTIFRPAVRSLMDSLSEGASYQRVLDLGCGSGVGARMVAHHVKPDYVLGLDHCQEALAVAERMTARDSAMEFWRSAIHYARADAMSQDYFGRFDLIMAAHLVDGFDSPEERQKILRFIARHLAPNGVAIISSWPYTWDRVPVYDAIYSVVRNNGFPSKRGRRIGLRQADLEADLRGSESDQLKILDFRQDVEFECAKSITCHQLVLQWLEGSVAGSRNRQAWKEALEAARRRDAIEPLTPMGVQHVVRVGKKGAEV